MGAKSSTAAGHRFAGSLRRSSSRDSGDGGRAPRPAAAPTVEEVMLAARFADGDGAAGAPPFYAVAAQWFDAWRLFVAGEAQPPGPVANGPLVDGSAPCAGDVVWVRAEDWRLLRAQHGGGPVLRRASAELFPPAEPPSTGPQLTDGGAGEAGGGAEGERLRALLREARGPLAAGCGALGRELAAEAAHLREGPWAVRGGLGGRRSGRPAERAAAAAQSAARSRVLEAAESQYGGEELKEALEALRPLEGGVSLQRLDELMHQLCALEEAQVATACLLQALQDYDRLGVELWLEQVDAMGLEGLLARISGEQRWLGLLAGLRTHLGALEERERRALHGHAERARASAAPEGPQERLWRQTVFAIEANDEETLAEVIRQAELDGLDATAAKLAREELRARTGRPPLAEGLGRGAPGPEPYASPSARARPPRWGSYAEGGEDDLGDFARQRERQAEFERQQAREEFDRIMAENQRRWAEERRAREQEERARAEARRRDQESRQRERERQEEESSQRFRREREEYERWRQRNAAPPPRPPPSYAYFRPGVSDALRSLGLPPGPVPPVADIKAAYKRAALRCHPDRPQNRDRQAEATAEFQRVKQAFDLLVPSSGA